MTTWFKGGGNLDEVEELSQESESRRQSESKGSLPVKKGVTTLALQAQDPLQYCLGLRVLIKM